jgi:ribonuclease J
MDLPFDLAPGADQFFFLPLGGTGEIGMNLNLYGHAGRWLMIDLGVTFPEEGAHPGVEVIMPDPTFIVERREALAGLVLTHGHEDHIGAVPYLWPRLKCPVYATPFTAHLVRRKLQEAGLLGQVDLYEVPLAGRFTVGPFELELIGLTHSIPEPNAIVIRTRLGTVLHTGDWKFDPDPVVGLDYDHEALKALADEGVLALVGDSTNALVEGTSGSEAEVRAALIELVGQQKHRVAVACFATNVARVDSVLAAAKASNRRVCLVGRSMKRVFEAACDTGYLKHLPPMVEEQDAGYLPRDEVLLLVTGSQGEPRAALSRLAQGENRQVSLERGDSVIFSSRVIPGNERAIDRLQAALLGLGLSVLTDADHFVHVSGHPARDELIQMYQWVRPKVAIPVHGEPRHLTAHAALAAECQVPHTIVAANGELIRLAPGRSEAVAHVRAGRLALDGTRLVPVESGAIRARQKLAYAGSALATVVLDRKNRLLAEPRITLQGLMDDEAELDWAAAELRQAFDALKPAERSDDAQVREMLRRALRRAMHRETGKKPLADVQVIRV